MSEHRLTEEGIRKALRITRTRSVMTFVIIEGFVAYYGRAKSGSPGLTLVMMAVSALALGIGFFRGTRRVRQQLTSYVVTLNDDRIRRDIAGMPAIEIARADVTAIEERRPGGLAVYGGTRRNFVGVNDDTEGYAAIREELATWRPFDEKRPAKGAAAIGTLILTIAAFAVTILSHNRLIVALVGSALAIGIVVSGVMLWRSPHVDRKTKRMLFILPLPLAAIIVRVVWALAGADFPD